MVELIMSISYVAIFFWLVTLFFALFDIIDIVRSIDADFEEWREIMKDSEND